MDTVKLAEGSRAGCVVVCEPLLLRYIRVGPLPIVAQTWQRNRFQEATPFSPGREDTSVVIPA